jgi:hypothetical protein
LGGAVCVLAGYAQTTAAMTAADKEPINVALNAFIRVPTPKNPQWILNRILQRCQPLLTIDRSGRRASHLAGPSRLDRRGVRDRERSGGMKNPN